MLDLIDDASGAPLYTRAQVDHCAFAAWYPPLAHVSVKSEIIELPPAFVTLLLADGVKLTTMCRKIDELRDEPLSEQLPSAADAASAQLAAESSVRARVETALAALKDSAFPKLNWSCPRDASWMLGALKCVNYEDVFLLLKASDFVVHDLTQPYAGCCEPQFRDAAPESVTLVLKKWCNFFDSMHFRCFVVAHTLVGVSQRHCDEFYEFLLDQQELLCEQIYRFFHAHLAKRHGAFPDPDFIFDVYVDKQHRVFLVDMNVFGAVTDPLLFSWEELISMRNELRRRCALRREGEEGEGEEEENEEGEEQAVDFRIVESSKGIRPNLLSSYRAPTDFVDHLAGAGGFDAFIDQVRRDNAGLTDDDDEEEEEEEEDDDDVKWGSDNDDYD